MPRRSRDADGPSLEGLAGATLAVALVYLGVEAAMPGSVHPLHWLITIGGAILGYAVGNVIYLLRDRRVRPMPLLRQGYESKRRDHPISRPRRRRR